MEQNTIQAVCDFFNIGSMLSCSALPTARTHDSLKVDTPDGTYVIKSFPTTSKQSLINSESIAKYVANADLPAITATEHNNNLLFEHQNNLYIAYPYIDSHTYKRSEISLEQSMVVSAFLAKLHNLNITLPAEPEWTYQYHPRIWQAAEAELPMVEQMKPIIEHCYQTYADLKNKTDPDIITSHRDIDDTNIIWKNTEEFFIIDWELAGKIDAAVELMYVAIIFCMELDQYFNLEKFQAILKQYLELRPIKTKNCESLLYSVLVMSLSWSQNHLQYLKKYTPDQDEYKHIANGIKSSFISVNFLLSIKQDINNAWQI
jgi:thiamine kinase-like enzyme